jgi:hypothetical protein
MGLSVKKDWDVVCEPPCLRWGCGMWATLSEMGDFSKGPSSQRQGQGCGMWATLSEMSDFSNVPSGQGLGGGTCATLSEMGDVVCEPPCLRWGM